MPPSPRRRTFMRKSFSERVPRPRAMSLRRGRKAPITHRKQGSAVCALMCPKKSGNSPELQEKYGRHEETRTPDLYRVKVLRCCTHNNLQVAGDCRATRKYAEAQIFTGDFTGEILHRDNAAGHCGRFGHSLHRTAIMLGTGVRLSVIEGRQSLKYPS